VSATTPGMRHIWMDAVLRCIDQPMDQLADVCVSELPTSSDVVNVDVKSDLASPSATSSADDISTNRPADDKPVLVSHNDAKTAKYSQTPADIAEPPLSSVLRLQYSDIHQPPANSYDSTLHSESKPTDVCTVSFHSFYKYLSSAKCMLHS